MVVRKAASVRIAGLPSCWQYGNMATRQCGNEAKAMKRPSLAERMQSVAQPGASPLPPAKEPATAPPSPANDGSRRERGFYAATRAGKKKITAAVAPDVHLRFRQLGLEAGKSNESLLIEAISDLFIKYGKPPIVIA
jgi:hypothetical protein